MVFGFMMCKFKNWTFFGGEGQKNASQKYSIVQFLDLQQCKSKNWTFFWGEGQKNTPNKLQYCMVFGFTMVLIQKLGIL
jgi:hypothetical protein